MESDNKKIIKNNLAEECCVEKIFSVLKGKWSFMIIKNLFDGTKRFGELRAYLNNVSPKTLTLRLRELEQNGIVNRKVYPVIPPAVEYSLTEKGIDLLDVITEMENWKEKWYRKSGMDTE